jgi:hypothetical protein
VCDDEKSEIKVSTTQAISDALGVCQRTTRPWRSRQVLSHRLRDDSAIPSSIEHRRLQIPAVRHTLVDMSALQSLEDSLNDIFVEKGPPLPASGKKALVKYLPWFNLVLGSFTLYSLYAVWHWAGSRLGFGIWLGLIVLAVEALLYIAAYPGTRDRKKAGWDLLFYALLVNIVYGVVILFTTYGSIGNLIGAVIGSAIGLYLLFQIRASYVKSPAV